MTCTLSATRLASLRRCPRQHFLRYELGLVRVRKDAPLRFGTAFHLGQQLAHGPQGADAAAVIDAATADYATCPDWADATAWAVEREQVRSLLAGHFWRYSQDDLEYVAVAADTARRVIHVRLDVLDEKPEERTGFRHPNLLAWTGQNRGRLLSSALTILSAYCRAGRPAQKVAPYGSFEGWSDLVRQAVVWAGLPDPCLTRVKLAESADAVTDSLGQLLAAWKQYDPLDDGVVIADMLQHLYPAERHNIPTDEASVSMRAALEGMVGCPAGRPPNAKQVANKLRVYRRRVLGSCFLDIDNSRGRKDGRTWRLFRPLPDGVGDTGDTGDSFSTHAREKQERESQMYNGLADRHPRHPCHRDGPQRPPPPLHVTILRLGRCVDCRKFHRNAHGEFFCESFIGGTSVVWATGERRCDPPPDAWHYCRDYRPACPAGASPEVWVWPRWASQTSPGGPGSQETAPAGCQTVPGRSLAQRPPSGLPDRPREICERVQRDENVCNGVLGIKSAANNRGGNGSAAGLFRSLSRTQPALPLGGEPGNQGKEGTEP